MPFHDDDAPPMQSDLSVEKMFDSITASLIDETPSFGEITSAITAMPTINALAIMRGQQPGPGAMPSTILRANRAAAAKERITTLALLQDAEAHEMQKRRLANQEAAVVLDTMKEQAKMGAAGIGAAYKVFMDIGKDMNPQAANGWLARMMQSDIGEGEAMRDEASGRAFALRTLLEAGGIQPRQAKAPSGYEWDAAGGLRPIRGGPGDPEAAGRLAAARRKPAGAPKAAAAPRPSQSLYRVETETGETVYLPREQAIGRKAPKKRDVIEELLGAQRAAQGLPDPLGIR